MTSAKKVNYNTETSEIEIREFTVQELQEAEAEKATQQEAEAQKAANKAALLEKLGISEDEARLLLG